MILPDWTLKSLMYSGAIDVAPIEDIQIQSASIDLRLDDSFLEIEGNTSEKIRGGFTFMDVPVIDLDEEVKYKEHTLPYIGPNQFLLGTTVETVKLPADIGAIVCGRSSIGRAGLCVENAGWIDPGFEGKITLELQNIAPHAIKKPIGKRVCQIIFIGLSGKCEKPYGCEEIGSKYQGQDNVTGSKIHMDGELNDKQD